jgi:DNA-binding CsgD family transcriptional regulator
MIDQDNIDRIDARLSLPWCPDDLPVRLSPQQARIYERLRSGHSRAEIAGELRISPEQFDVQLERIVKKLSTLTD